MRLSKLNASDFAGAELAYLREAAKRLSSIFDEPLSHLEAIALMQIITLYTFIFHDGFVLNDMADHNRMIGLSSAAAIAAALCDDPSGKDWLWWKAEYPTVDTASNEFEAVHSRMLSTIVRDPSVRKTVR